MTNWRIANWSQQLLGPLNSPTVTMRTRNIFSALLCLRHSFSSFKCKMWSHISLIVRRRVWVRTEWKMWDLNLPQTDPISNYSEETIFTVYTLVLLLLKTESMTAQFSTSFDRFFSRDATFVVSLWATLRSMSFLFSFCFLLDVRVSFILHTFLSYVSFQRQNCQVKRKTLSDHFSAVRNGS